MNTFNEFMDKWISSSPDLHNQKNLEYVYFYMKWLNTKEPEITASWYTSIPDKCTFKKDIYWKEFKKKITICGELSFNHIDLVTIDKPKKTIHNIPLLKSLLQKSIRRKNARSAILSGYECMNKNILQLLRRLPIIMLEDAFIHPSINIIIWFMAASPQIILDSIHKSYILGIIYEMAVSNIRHPIIKKEQSDSVYNYVSKNDYSQDLRNLILSLYLRKSFGGMKGDMKMINGFIDNILPDIHNKYDVAKIRHIQIHDTLEYKDILKSAADFHCFPGILLDIQKHHKYEMVDIKNAIWIHSSSIRYKEIYSIHITQNTSPYSNKYISIWKDIQNTYEKYAHKYINRSLYNTR